MFHPSLLINLRKCTQHGGESSKGKRKTARPLAIKRPTLIIFKASGEHLLLTKENTSIIKKRIQKHGKAHRVAILRLFISPNEVKLIIQGATREGLVNFFRTFSATTAVRITIAKAGPSLTNKKPTFERPFWLGIHFSQIMDWMLALNVAAKLLTHFQLLACLAFRPLQSDLYIRETAPG